MAASPSVDAAAFCRELEPHLAAMGSVWICDRDSLAARGLGPSSDCRHTGRAGRLRARLWLDRLAAGHEVVVVAVEADDVEMAEVASGWGEHLVVVADADGSVRPRPTERRIASALWARRLLVLRQARDREHPQGTRRWLEPRSIDLHLHARRGRPDDLARVARHLLRRPVCLVLGGGGGRGFAHLGVLRRLTEEGIPVDAICGTSAGAILGAAIARGHGIDALMAHFRGVLARQWILRPVIPMMSLVSDQPLRELGRSLYGDAQIEDLWLPFACNASNLTQRRKDVFDRGPLAPAVLASSALPGLFPPVVIGDELFVDGALLLNLPVAPAQERWGGTTVVVDIGGPSRIGWAERALPTPFEAMMRYVRREGAPPTVATTILSAFAAAADEQSLDARARADLLILPDVLDYPITDFRPLDELVELGAEAADRALALWRPSDPAVVRPSAERTAATGA
jgi:predicted acylesterase/phospholipase RssA